MSLVLNGNGTIQNLVAGGLPDGSVTADDIASTLDLSGKTVTLPAGTGGKVVKVSTYQKSSYVDTAGSTFVDAWSETYTPVASGNTILVHMNPELRASRNSGSDGRFYVKVVIDGTSYPGSSGYEMGAYDYGGSGPWLDAKPLFLFYHTLSSTSPITISLQFHTGGQAQNVALNNANWNSTQVSSLVVTEIAA